MVDKSFIIVVNSISGGGKTTITRALQKTLENSKAIFFDDGNYDVDSGIDDICKWVEDGADANEFNLEPLVEKIEIMAKEQVKYIIIDSGRNAYLSGCELGKENADFIVDGNPPVKEVVDTILEKVS